MLDDDRLENFKELKEKIQKFTQREKSLLERYDINYTGMLIYSEDEIDVEFCQEHIRESDFVVALEPNLVFIIYSVVDGEGAVKAAQHILHNYQKKYTQDDLYVVLSSQDQKISVTELEGQLVQLLHYVIQGKIPNTIITMYNIL